MEDIRNYIGTWKFAPQVKIQEIEALGRELAKDENYLSIYIRKASKDQYGLGFEYKNQAGGDEETFNNYMHQTEDALLRKFGRGLVGWDVSSNYFKIK